MNNIYKQKVEILLKVIPIIAEENCFAIHGGTAINLFVKDLPRYSVDIDLTYVPIEERNASITKINERLTVIAEKIKKTLRGVRVISKPEICKLLCEYQNKQIKIEVNLTKRGIVCGELVRMPICDKAQEEFKLYCEAYIVPFSLLYGGKVAASLSRQHPRDLFDVKYMDIEFNDIKPGFIYCLLSSDRPIYESFAPNLIDQRDAMENQFVGMTDVAFDYDEFEETRSNLIRRVNEILSYEDKLFLISFEEGFPLWEGSPYSSFQNYPSVKWKQLNILKLKQSNPKKLKDGVDKLKQLFGRQQVREIF